VSSTTLTSDRLDLVPLTAQAIEALMARDGERLSQVTGALFPAPVELPPLLDDALSSIRDRLRLSPGSEDWWLWLATRRDTREPIGVVGLGGGPDAGGAVTVGYSIYPAHQGLGYATEALRALIGWALSRPRVTLVRATVPPWNGPSLRVAEKAGMRQNGRSTDAEVGEVLVFEVRLAAPVTPAVPEGSITRY
jgi:RimJ/RimL family protein N-acetyltransferase